MGVAVLWENPIFPVENSMSLAEQAVPSGRPPSPFYTEEHEAFRSTVRRFVERL